MRLMLARRNDMVYAKRTFFWSSLNVETFFLFSAMCRIQIRVPIQIRRAEFVGCGWF